MGGDLNLKKSWHPVLMSNQRRVWEEEKKALDERKRTDQRIKELKEERAKEEIQAKLEAAGSRKRVDRVDWMYQGPSSGQAGTTEEMEGYLLGKRRIDGLIKGTEHKKLQKQASEDSFMALQHANTARDTAAKIREDPMLAIKRQEQIAYQAMMNDPIKRRQLLALAGQGEEKREKEEQKKSRRHHHHQKRTYESDDEQRSKRRRRDDDNSHRSARLEYRGKSPVSRQGRGRRRTDGDRDYDDKRRKYSLTPDFSRSRSPVRRDNRDRRWRRTGSPEERGRGRVDRERDYDRRQQRSSSESSSPHRRRISPDHRKSPPVGRDERRDVAYNVRGRMSHRTENRRIEHYGEMYGQRGSGASNTESSVDRDAARQRKLTAMQQDAFKLDVDREKRLAAIAEREKAEREIEDKARARSSKYGDKADFVSGIHRKAGDMSLADRIGRGRQGLQKNDE